MKYLIANLVSLALVAGFFAFSSYEKKKGTRLFANDRVFVDEWVTRASFILSHVDFIAFVRDLVTSIASRVMHDIVHFSLLGVRAVERFLTRLVRYLRIRHANDAVPSENTREFVKTLSDFKGKLETMHPEVPDILSQ